MSARAMMSDAVQISELDMPYHERVGESKLHVIRDGIRFLRVIVETGFLYRPSRPLNLAGIILTLISSVLMFPPLVYYLQHRAVLEWMIYRFLVSHLLGTAACLAFCASFILSQMTEIALGEEIGKRKPAVMQRFFHSGWFWVVNAGLTIVGGSLVLGSLLQLLETGSTYEHWSRFIAMTFCLSIVTILLITRCTEYVLGLVRERVLYRQNSGKA
jgi:MFS family permease